MSGVGTEEICCVWGAEHSRLELVCDSAVYVCRAPISGTTPKPLCRIIQGGLGVIG